MFSSALKSFSSNISANYNLSANPTATAGAWKVFEGKSKKTGKIVSVFVFDRKSLEPSGAGFRNRSNGSSRRKIYDEVVERLKKEASSLARLRHPNILELAEPVEDTRNGGLMFATEPITATLSGLLSSQGERERGRGRATSYYGEGSEPRSEVEIDELEIQKGLLQVAKGLEFLHESAGLVHGNLTPDSIYINQKSDWKISGLAFSGPPDAPTSATPSGAPPIALSELLYYDPRLPRTVQLNLDYTSPDFVMDSNISSAADMFSLGLIMLALYNSPHESSVHTNGNVSAYKKIFASSSTVPTINNNFLSQKTLPDSLRTDVLPRLITRRPAQRITAREFQESRFFDNILVSALRFLESLPAKTANEKSQFLRGLPRFLNQFPKSVLDKKVLPALLEETKDRELLALIMGNIFKMIPMLPSAHRSFSDKILPKLWELFVSRNAKGATTERESFKEAGLAVVLEHMALVKENCSGKAFKDDVLPIVQTGLESPTHAIVDKSLSCLPTLLAVLDFSTIKNELFPIVAAVFTRTSSLAIKVRGLEAFVVLCGGTLNSEHTLGDSGSAPSSAILDKYTVQEKIIPLLKGMKTKEPAVMMAALKVFKEVGKIADSEFLATDVLPLLWSFSLGPLLNLQQFKEFMNLMKQLSSKIEEEQTRKLRELASTSQPNGFLSPTTDLMSSGPIGDPLSPSMATSVSDFENLVLGKPSLSNNFESTATTTINNPFGAHPGSPISASSFWSSNQATSTTNNSRAITPDSSFTSFQATSAKLPPGSLQQPLNPTSPPANPWASPPQSGGVSGNTAWAASPPQTGVPSLSPNAWTSQSSQSSTLSSLNSLSTSNNNAWARPPRPQQPQNLNAMSMGQGSSASSFSGLQQPLQPLQPLQPSNIGSRNEQPQQPSLFNIAPPPGGTGMGGLSNGQKGQTKKTGLDAYESLI